jgi:hypothetical protein
MRRAEYSRSVCRAIRHRASGSTFAKPPSLWHVRVLKPWCIFPMISAGRKKLLCAPCRSCFLTILASHASIGRIPAIFRLQHGKTFEFRFFFLFQQVQQQHTRFSNHGMSRPTFAPSSRKFLREHQHPWTFWSSRAMVSKRWWACYTWMCHHLKHPLLFCTPFHQKMWTRGGHTSRERLRRGDMLNKMFSHNEACQCEK